MPNHEAPRYTERVYHFLRDVRPNQPTTPTDVSSSLDITPDTAGKALYSLARNSFPGVRRLRRGVYTYIPNLVSGDTQEQTPAHTTAPSSTLFELVTTLKNQGLLIQDEEGRLFVAHPVNTDR